VLTNEHDPEAARLLEQCRNDIQQSAAFLDALRRHADPYEVRLQARGYEFAAAKPVDGRPNRAVVKLFIILDGPLQGQAAAFFYKPSQIPTSRDRFSYGVCTIPRTGPENGETDAWIAFASSGFHPDARPPRIRRAFTFNVPE
jgi:hypothetical protein